MNFKISKIQHVGIPVTELKTSVEFYSKLGFTEAMRAQFDHNDEKGNVVMMQSGEVIMELYEFPAKDLEEIRSRSHGHIDHIAFDVEDVEAVFKELQAAGYEIQEDAPVFLNFWDKGCKYFNIVGPDGEQLEFNEIL
ncbi:MULTISPECIES: VOC family protein [unclassified Leeuwenhoekiella]|uniref:VOC family protein n=1 Tax=unclassified Leeuwenhoekiella TaxID=2615029 RepID=UPI000C3CEFFA|nr:MULTISPECIES: VOC family protein [unclassified Leeuwenhoekiella]MAW93619.1 glyoxalase/bleomycin resistance/extradiol dioxygenase family protein [Leeuwenhoekiella sp.]|tara:strand:- start:9543 stop:9953 length:411 start_codon:yes stop_codon:yes gene_type:complete